ncbi:hypothetical protein Q4491_02410 [Photobacterium sp. 2_MG-2023]|uniref:hypothetical protein n=1 Tax=Photobacterium sp. 2_MG-2023 TaxID=3062663 RepID=UPI0026E461E5|nr:hypothetical protein [Photobacterium sp. 2_MG-2023]MDO6580185.1 hypothetical protein [Photobacterium sp. 2_MG-2023]
MRKKRWVLLSGLLASFSLQAASLDSLKSVPASQYDFGKLQLELSAYLFTDKLKDERINGTSFKVEKFEVEESDNKLLLVSNLVGKTKDISESQCNTLLVGLTKNYFFSNLPKKIWPDLPEKEYVGLSEEVKLSIKLISKENSEFFVQC